MVFWPSLSGQEVLRKTLAELQFEDACGTTPAAPHRRKAFPVEDLAWPQFQSAAGHIAGLGSVPWCQNGWDPVGFKG
jgi:hypothetical protein